MNIFLFILNSFVLFVKNGFQFACQAMQKVLQWEARAFKKLKLRIWGRTASVEAFLRNSLTILLSTLLGATLRELLEEMSDRKFDQQVDRLEDKLVDEIHSNVDSYITFAIERWDAWGNVNETLQEMIANVLIEKETLVEATIQAQIAKKLEAKVESVELYVEMFPLG